MERNVPETMHDCHNHEYTARGQGLSKNNANHNKAYEQEPD